MLSRIKMVSLFVIIISSSQGLKATPVEYEASCGKQYERTNARIDSLPDNDSLILKLKSFNLALYEGLTVDTLIRHLPSGVAGYQIGGGDDMRVARMLFVKYPDEVSVVIYVHHFTHMNPNAIPTSSGLSWDLSLFKKEAIHHTVIYNGSNCINGCDKEFEF